VDSFSGKLALEIALSAFERACCSHLLCQVFQNLKGVSVQTVSDIGEVVNYGPGPNHRYRCDGKLEPLPCRTRPCNACQCSVEQLIIVVRWGDLDYNTSLRVFQLFPKAEAEAFFTRGRIRGV